MKYAILTSGGKQYRAQEGETITVDALPQKNGPVTFDSILLLVSDGMVHVGNPTVKNAQITATILGQKKGEKIRVATYKSKVRYRRVKGFRPLLSTVKIDTIEVSGTKDTSKKPLKEKKTRTRKKTA